MKNQENIQRFEELLGEVDRPGMDRLLDYIRKSDFYTAPASTKYHSCHEGGLLEHSLNVFDCLINKMNSNVWGAIVKEAGRESIIVSALLHDICKTDFYVTEYKNKKIYSEHGAKFDSNGRFDWVSVPGYTVDNSKHPLGHGEGSVIMLQQFIHLKPIELYAIRFHMLFSEPKELYSVIGEAIKKHPFVLAINEADLEATYLLEEEE